MDERQNSQNNKLIPAVLVLEGGATRGVFTSGVLDFLMEKDFYTTDVIGVSARGLQRNRLCVQADRTHEKVHDTQGKRI